MAAGAKPYALLVRELQSTGKVAIVRFVMRSRQYTAAVRADDGRLTMSTLAYADELVPAADVEELAARLRVPAPKTDGGERAVFSPSG